MLKFKIKRIKTFFSQIQQPNSNAMETHVNRPQHNAQTFANSAKCNNKFQNSSSKALEVKINQLACEKNKRKQRLKAKKWKN